MGEPKKLETFDDFWLFYLHEHSNFTNRVLHFIGSAIALGWLGYAIYARNAWFVLAALVSGYAFAWIGHFFVEKNRPATFTYPFRSLACDWVMFLYILTGQIGKQLKRVEEVYPSAEGAKG